MSSCHHLSLNIQADDLSINAATQLLSGAITGELDFDLEAALKSAVMAGALSAATDIIDIKMDYATQNSDGSIALKSSLDYGQKISREILHGLTKKAIYGGDIEAILAESAGNVAFEYIGHDLPDQLGLDKDSIQTKALITTTHSLVGGVLSELGGGDFSSGAIATATSHVVAEYFLSNYIEGLRTNQQPPLTSEQLLAITDVIAAAVVLATHENVTDEELAIAQSMGSSVVEHNVMPIFTLFAAVAEGMTAEQLLTLEVAMLTFGVLHTYNMIKELGDISTGEIELALKVAMYNAEYNIATSINGNIEYAKDTSNDGSATISQGNGTSTTGAPLLPPDDDDKSASERTPDLTGKSRSETDKILKDLGFKDAGTTPGGYRKYYHPDGSKIQIRPNGEIVRTGPKVQNPNPNEKGYKPRIDQNGNQTGSHNTGEILK